MFGLHSGYWTTFVASTASDLIGNDFRSPNYDEMKIAIPTVNKIIMFQEICIYPLGKVLLFSVLA